MKLHSVEAVNRQTGKKQVFTFGTGASPNKLVLTQNDLADKYLKFCLCGDVQCDEDVFVRFSVDNIKYVLKRYHGSQGTYMQFQKITDDEVELIAEGNDVPALLEELLGMSPAALLANDFVEQSKVDAFDGNLNVFRSVELLRDIIGSANKETAELTEKCEDIKRKMDEITNSEQHLSNKKQLEQANQQLRETSEELLQLTERLNQLKTQQAESTVTTQLLKELEKLQTTYRVLSEQKEAVEEQRESLRRYDNVMAVLPKVEREKILQEAVAECEHERDEFANDVQFQESELNTIEQQWLEKQQKLDIVADRKRRIEIINAEIATIGDLQSRNDELKQKLMELNDQAEQIEAERAQLKQKLNVVEGKITEARGGMDSVQFPNRSVGELLDMVRIGVMIDEVRKQRDQVQAELTEKEQQINEKENIYLLQRKRFKSVAELDGNITPVKAKDTILQVLDARYNKLLLINDSLTSKKRNLQRAKEDYDHRLLELEHSKNLLDREVNRLRLCKQEEFKREVLLNSQKLYTQGEGSVYAATTDITDQEVATVMQDSEKRLADYEVLLAKRSEVQGRLDEIVRQIEINEADMAALRQEKTNINNRYNEIVTRNRNDDVSNYLKALESNNGTQYLLQAQEDTVRNDVELKRLRGDVEDLRTQLGALKARLNHLEETQQQMEDSSSTLEQFIGTNDRVKEELCDMSERMASSYEQYKSLTTQLEQLDSNFVRVQASIMEHNRAIQANEEGIQKATEHAKEVAEKENYDLALSEFNYEINSLQSETDQLTDSRYTVEKELFGKKVTYEKLLYTYGQLKSELDDVSRALESEMEKRGITQEDIEQYKDQKDSTELREAIVEYDERCKKIAERIDRNYKLLQQQPESAITAAQNLDKDIADTQAQIDAKTAEKAELEQKCNDTMQHYVASNNTKLHYVATATEAGSMKTMRSAIRKNKMVLVLAQDKLKWILNGAQRYLRIFTGEEYFVDMDNYGMLNLRLGDKTWSYAQLDASLKVQVYLSLIFGVPQSEETRCSWVLLDEGLDIDKQELQTMMSKVVDFDCVIALEN